MRKLLLCVLVILCVFQISVTAESTEVVQKEILPEETTQALSVNDFVTDTEYPYETVGYFLNDVAFLGEDAMAVSITFTGNYGSNEYFFSKCYIPVYDYESGKLLDIFYSDVGLERPFANSSRTTIKRVISTKNIDADIYKIKVIMLESLTSLRPNCPVPYLANELVISKNDIKQELPTVKITTKLHSVPLSNDSPYIALGSWYNAEYSDAAIAMGYQNYNQIPSVVNCNNFDLKPYQGLVCDLVLDLSEDSDIKILSVTPTEGKNVEVTIEPSMLANKNNAGYVAYYKTNNDDRVSKLKLEGTPATYVNLESGVYAADVAVGGNAGDVAYRYVDTDNNGSYDTVFVDNERVFVVGNVNTTSNKIFRDTASTSLTTFTGASLTLDPENNTLAWSIKDTEGNEMGIADIKAGDVVAVKTSNVGSDTYYDITISNETVTGTITETFQETAKVSGATLYKFKIGDADYMMLDNSAMTPGDSIVAKVYGDKVVAYDVEEGVKNYAIIVDANRAEDFGVTYQLQIFTQKGELVTLNFADKVNGATPSYATTAALKAAFIKGDLIAYELNKAGEIKAIDTQTADTDFVLKATDKFAATSSEYKPISQKLGSYFITDDTVILIAADTKNSITKDDVALGTADILEAETTYNYSVIANSDKEAMVVVLFEVVNFPEEPEIPEEISEIQYGVIVAVNRAENFGATYQVQVLDQTGEFVTLNLAEVVNGYRPSYVTTSSLYYAFPRGDIIAYQLNNNGEIKYYDTETEFNAGFSNVLDPNANKVSYGITQYNSSTKQLGACYLTEETSIFASDSNKGYVAKDNIALISEDILTEDANYTYTILHNAKKEAKIVVLFELEALPEEPEIPEEPSEMQYGMIIDANRAEDFGVTYQLQILNQEGEIQTLNFAKKVNGTTPSYATTAALNAAFVKGDLIAYQLNSNDEIKAIDTQTADTTFVLDISDRFESRCDDYNATSQKLGSYSINENTIVFVTDTVKFEITKNDVMLDDISCLIDDYNYEYSVIYNEDKEAKVIVLFAATGQINFNSYPLVITKTSAVAMADGTTRTKFTGYVNGEEVALISAEDTDSSVWQLTVGDIAMYVTNREGELTKAYTLADKTSAGIVVKANYADDDEDGDVAGNMVTLSITNRTAAGCMTVGAAHTLKGFGAAGKAYKVQGNILRLVKAADYAVTFNGSFRDYTNVVDDDMIQDYYVDTNTVAYLYNPRTNKYQLTTLLGAESDYNTADYLIGTQIDNDDLIYVYNYDGGTKLILIVDVMGDNL